MFEVVGLMASLCSRDGARAMYLDFSDMPDLIGVSSSFFLSARLLARKRTESLSGILAVGLKRPLMRINGIVSS